jgi:uncharacterized protein YggE
MKYLLNALICGMLGASATATADETPRSVSVTGEASIMAPPDRASVSAAVQARNIDLTTARLQVVDVTGKFLAVCKKLRIDESKVSTTGLTMQPEYRWDPKNSEQVLTGYFVSRQLQVELDDIELIGKLIEGAVDAGVNQVSPPVLDSSRRKELHRKALAAAADDARENARVLAATLGVKLGPVRTIDASSGGRPSPLVRGQMIRTMEADMAPEATYQAGDIEFQGRVNATFDLLTD